MSEFLPAMSFPSLTVWYDLVIAATTRETFRALGTLRFRTAAGSEVV